MSSYFATSLGNFRTLFFPDVVEIRSERRQSLIRLLNETEMQKRIRKCYFYNSTQYFCYIRVSKQDWQVLKRVLEEHSGLHHLGAKRTFVPVVEQEEPTKDELRVMNEQLLLEAQQNKPLKPTSFWTDEIKDIAPFVHAVQDITDTGTYRGRPCDGRSAEFILLRVNFGDSKMKTTLDEDYSIKLSKIDTDYLCEFGDIDMIVHAISHFYQEREDENFLFCLNALLNRSGYKHHQKTNDLTEDRQSVYQGDTKFLGAIAREGGPIGSISLYDDYSEESSAQEEDRSDY